MAWKAAAEVVIVGAGIAGISVALHLANLGCRDVVVLDRSRRRYTGSTGHAPGLLARNSGSWTSSRLASYTADYLEALPGETPVVTRVGSVEVTRSKDLGDEFALKLDVAQRNGLTATALDQRQLRSMVPYMETGPVAHAIHVEGDAVVDAVAATERMRALAEAAGVVVVDGAAVSGFRRQGDRVDRAITTGGEIACGTLVVAAGFWGGHLLQTLGVNIPLLPVAHPFVWTTPSDHLAGLTGRDIRRPIVRDVDNVLYLRERGPSFGIGWYRDRFTVPSVAGLTTATLDYPCPGRHQHLEHDLFPFLRTTPAAEEINGIFSMTPDNGPLVGPVAGLDNVLLAEAVWVTASAGVGRVVAEMALGLELFVDPAPLAPDRFAHLSPEAATAASLAKYDNLYRWPARAAVPA